MAYTFLQLSKPFVSKLITSSVAANVSRSLIGRHFASRSHVTANQSPTPQNSLTDQMDQMKQELCPIVDKDDNVIGFKSKYDCHQMNLIDDGLLHRAFSILVFNSKNEFLITQRSFDKLTFPGYYTNACCSHPNEHETDLSNNFSGTKRAAIRRLQFELGIPNSELKEDDFHLMTRLIYVCSSDDPQWGEHELDHLMILKKDLDINPLPSEVNSWYYLNRKQMNLVVEQAEAGNIKLSPWTFKICKLFLNQWWDRLDNLDSIKDVDTIHSTKVQYRGRLI